MNKTNLIYIHSHDVGRYIQPFGYGIDTPNLQRLAESGMLFRNSIVQRPVVLPAARQC